MRLTRVLRQEGGSTIVIGLLTASVMLLLGTALLAIVDSQAGQSRQERTRDHAFNLAESVLTNQAFVLGRSWPEVSPGANPACAAAGAGFADTIGASGAATAEVKRLRPTLNSSYTDSAYTGATWQVNVCDDTAGETVWKDTVLNNKTWDANDNDLLWVRAQSTVKGTTRVLTGLVKARPTQVLDSRFALTSGRVKDDLGTAVNALSANAAGGVLSSLYTTTPTVAADPNKAATVPPNSGVTGLRCGVLDVSLTPPKTCLSGTLGATAALPIVSTLLTGGKLEQFPTDTAATALAISQLRSLAKGTGTYYASSPGASTAAGAPACDLTSGTGTKSVSTIVFLEQVGSGDDYCVVNVGSGVQYKALIVGSGRIVIRGNGTTTAAPSATTTGPQVNTFSGVLYALNLQRLAVADGGKGLGDATTPGREVVVIEKGAHVKGAVVADGKGAQTSVIPPEITINTSSLVDALIPCTTVLGVTSCLLRNTVKALGGVTAIVDKLIDLVGLTSVTNAILAQVQPQRTAYGSAITADVAAIQALTVYGSSGIVTGTFSDLNAG